MDRPTAQPRLTLKLDHCVVQAKDGFSFPKLTNPVDITSIGCAYKLDYVGQAMVTTPKKPEHLTWTGQDNIYDATRWLAAAPTVKDEKTWNTYWGGTDTDGTKRTGAVPGQDAAGSVQSQRAWRGFRV